MVRTQLQGRWRTAMPGVPGHSCGMRRRHLLPCQAPAPAWAEQGAAWLSVVIHVRATRGTAEPSPLARASERVRRCTPQIRQRAAVLALACRAARMAPGPAPVLPAPFGCRHPGRAAERLPLCGQGAGRHTLALEGQAKREEMGTRAVEAVQCLDRSGHRLVGQRQGRAGAPGEHPTRRGPGQSTATGDPRWPRMTKRWLGGRGQWRPAWRPPALPENPSPHVVVHTRNPTLFFVYIMVGFTRYVMRVGPPVGKQVFFV